MNERGGGEEKTVNWEEKGEEEKANCVSHGSNLLGVGKVSIDFGDN